MASAFLATMMNIVCDCVLGMLPHARSWLNNFPNTCNSSSWWQPWTLPRSRALHAKPWALQFPMGSFGINFPIGQNSSTRGLKNKLLCLRTWDVFSQDFSFGSVMRRHVQMPCFALTNLQPLQFPNSKIEIPPCLLTWFHSPMLTQLGQQQKQLKTAGTRLNRASSRSKMLKLHFSSETGSCWNTHCFKVFLKISGPPC